MMLSRKTSTFGLLTGVLVVPLAACAQSAGGAARPAEEPPVPAVHQEAAVNWHPQQKPAGNEGRVEDAWVALTRHEGGASYQFHARDLEPGHAYTLWLITVNDPDACEGTPCTGPELFDPDVDADAQVRFGAGHVVGRNGRATFAGHVKEGPLTGWLPDRSLDDATSAQFLFTLNDHGPALADHMPGMIHTYRGGCADDSPFPSIFPATALADGEPGPNQCLLSQSAAFPTP
ncbi:hypothetical protein CLV30_10586 [Haloactinopolyspora alba]|uniref:Uncharacterized protein n=1 Tax=Haloactinopolyspora alba TaxID=648780 RepID=A0A2P8E579_9ACTN|nr:hypothetical protein [Haloactinopolyspora alba]PSL04621.1 hypothetical protein CLV30_10586 [Haloactinopolyspora alba]